MWKKTVFLRILSVLALFYTICLPAQESPAAGARAQNPISTLDSGLIAIADRIHGFGGVFFGEDGTLYVYMTKPDEQLSDEAREARRKALMQELQAAFGRDFLDRGKEPRVEAAGQQGVTQEPSIVVIKGQYDILQLAQWRKSIEQVLEIQGVLLTDLDEKRNRLVIGVESDLITDRITPVLAETGIPVGAVIIEVTKPIEFKSTLRDKFRPPRGGIQVEADTGLLSYNICTIGFNGLIKTRGFLTCSHCTKTQGGTEDTDFHQPDDPWYTEGNKVGDEVLDPAYFTEGACPEDRRCRYSDSAFIDYDDDVSAGGAYIARTTSYLGSTTINSDKPTFKVIGEAAAPLAGVYLDKVGRTTGWTYGKVLNTCVTANVSGTDITLLCQDQVTMVSTSIDKIVASGDSGSPVFKWLGDTVILYGILWGGSPDDTLFTFSRMALIEQELGSAQTYDFPVPLPSLCPTGSKCCEPIGDRCLKCVPIGAECP